MPTLEQRMRQRAEQSSGRSGLVTMGMHSEKGLESLVAVAKRERTYLQKLNMMARHIFYFNHTLGSTVRIGKHEATISSYRERTGQFSLKGLPQGMGPNKNASEMYKLLVDQGMPECNPECLQRHG